MRKRILGPTLPAQLFLLCCSCGVVECQITSVNSDRHFIVGARIAALGDGGVADNDGISDLYYNPSAIAFMMSKEVEAGVSLERIGQSDFTMVENAAFPITVNDMWTVGFGATFSHVGKVQIDGPNQGFDYKLFATDLAVSCAVSNSLSLGVGLNAGLGFIDTLQLGAVSSSVGLFHTPERGVSYGIALQGFGWGLEFSPDSGGSVMKRVSLDQSFQIGVGLRFPKIAESPMVSILFATQKLLNRNELVYKGGIEYYPLKFVAIRWGYWLGRHTVAAKYGLGFRVGLTRLDYAISPSKLEPRFHQVSISYALGSGD